MKYFTLKELTHTNKNLPNVPDKAAEANLIQLVENVLDPLRELYGKPIKVNSGYRSQLVNAATENASKTSDHMTGRAADIDTISDNALLFKLIRDNFTFDQLIWEKGDSKAPSWIHVSYREGANRNQIKKYENGKYLVL
jgi:hypothetical protein